MEKPVIFRTLVVLLMVIGVPISSWALEVGDKAPNFTAVSTLGSVRLSDALGKQNVVLALYFAVFTPVWTNELIDFQRDLGAFNQLDAKIIGVSSDSHNTNLKFAKENGITFALVSDKDRAIRKKYGRGRVTYLIDKHGVIRWIQKGVPDNQAFLTKLKEIRQNPKP